MGLFKKLFTNLNVNANDKAFNKFMLNGSEFNIDIVPCYDVHYATSFLSQFIDNDSRCQLIHCDNHVAPNGRGLGACTIFKFNNVTYSVHGWAHYAKALILSYSTEIKYEDAYNYLNLCNLVNQSDRIHQVGLIAKADTNKIWLGVSRQFLLAPQYGGSNEFIKGLDEIKEYAQYLTTLPTSVTPNNWNRYAEKTHYDSSGKPIIGVKEILLPTDANNNEYWMPYIKDIKLLEQDNEREVYSMVSFIRNLKEATLYPFGAFFAPTNKEGTYQLSGGSPIANYSCQMFVWDEKIVLYKRFPYLYTLHATVGPITQRKNQDMIAMCNDWNSKIHITPSRLVYRQLPTGDYNVEIIMSGLFAEEGNIITDFDVFGTLAKTIAWVYGNMGY